MKSVTVIIEPCEEGGFMIAELVRHLKDFLDSKEKSLALFVWVKNLFVSMYGQRDFWGALISFVMRTFRSYQGALLCYFGCSWLLWRFLLGAASAICHLSDIFTAYLMSETKQKIENTIITCPECQGTGLVDSHICSIRRGSASDFLEMAFFTIGAWICRVRASVSGF